MIRSPLSGIIADFRSSVEAHAPFLGKAGIAAIVQRHFDGVPEPAAAEPESRPRSEAHIGDGWLKGKELDGLAIWRDVNANGVSEPGEVRPLADWGIAALRCRADAGPAAPYCAAQAKRGVVFRDGRSRPTFDLILERR